MPRPRKAPNPVNELEKVAEQFKEFDESIQALTFDRLNETPKQDLEPQTKLSQRDIANSKDIYLKPYKRVGGRDKFNERFRDDYNYDKELVYFIAENNEVGGEDIEIWTRPYGGVDAEFWKVPVGKPVWGPRYLAEQIKRKYYHRLIMQQKVVSDGSEGSYYGQMAADTTIQRLDARPATKSRSVFMGANNFA